MNKRNLDIEAVLSCKGGENELEAGLIITAVNKLVSLIRKDAESAEEVLQNCLISVDSFGTETSESVLVVNYTLYNYSEI